MLLQALGSCHVKMTRMRQKASNLFKVSWVNFFPDTRYIRQVFTQFRHEAHLGSNLGTFQAISVMKYDRGFRTLFFGGGK